MTYKEFKKFMEIGRYDLEEIASLGTKIKDNEELRKTCADYLKKLENLGNNFWKKYATSSKNQKSKTMIILPYVKMRTIPFGPAKVKRKKKLPIQGDIISIRENNNENTYTNPWIKIRVDQVKENDIFFVSKL